MAAAGAPLGGRYQLVADSTGKIDILGSGAFGIVCRAVDLQQNTTVALKLIFKAPGEPLRVGGELVLQHIQPHANVVRLFDYYPSMSSTELPMTHLAESLDPERPFPKSVFRTFRNGRFVAPMDAIEIAVLVFECIEGKELFDWLMEDGPEWWHGRDAAMDRPAESDVRGVMAGLVRAVAHLHSMGVCHLDLKLENVKLAAAAAGVPPSERARLLDFGFAEAGPNIGQLRCGPCGTETYMAPEMHTALPYDGCKADVFALGVCLYTLANKSPPWKHTRMNVAPGTLDENREQMGAHFERFVRNAHCNVSNHMMGKSRFSSQLTDLLNSMLAPESARRLATASEVLAHPWFSGPQGAQTRARAAAEGDPAPMEEEPIYRGRLGDDDESDDDDKMEDDKEEAFALPPLLPRRRAAMGGSVWERPLEEERPEEHAASTGKRLVLGGGVWGLPSPREKVMAPVSGGVESTAHAAAHATGHAAAGSRPAPSQLHWALLAAAAFGALVAFSVRAR